MGLFSREADYVRIVHLIHWESERNRFQDYAFNRSKAQGDGSPGGVSLVSAVCIREHGGIVCEHLRQYYPPNIVSDPAVFLCIKADECPDAQFVQKTTESGDVCHYD